MSAPSMERIRSMTVACASLFSMFPAKRLARAAGAHPKTAERWRRGEAAPSGDAVLRMMAADDDLFVAILSAAGRADDAARQRAIAFLDRAIQARAGGT